MLQKLSNFLFPSQNYLLHLKQQNIMFAKQLLPIFEVNILKFVMLVCMPALCIEFLALAPIESFDFLLLFGYFLSEIILFSLGAVIPKYIFKLVNSEALLIGLALALTNHVLFVLPIADEIFGEAKTLTIISIITMDGLVIFSLTLIAMDILSNADRPFSVTVKAIFTNPPLLGSLLAYLSV